MLELLIVVSPVHCTMPAMDMLTVIEGVRTYLASFSIAPTPIANRVKKQQFEMLMDLLRVHPIPEAQFEEMQRKTIPSLPLAQQQIAMLQARMQRASVQLVAQPQTGRRPMQDFQCLPHYLPEKLVALIMQERSGNASVAFNVVMHETFKFAIDKLGLRCPSEPSLACLTALAGFADQNWSFHMPSTKHQLFTQVKASFQSVVKNYPNEMPANLEFIARLPENPEALPDGWYEHAYPDGSHFTGIPEDFTITVMAMAREIPMRASNLRSRAHSHPYMNTAASPAASMASQFQALLPQLMGMLQAGTGRSDAGAAGGIQLQFPKRSRPVVRALADESSQSNNGDAVALLSPEVPPRASEVSPAPVSASLPVAGDGGFAEYMDAVEELRKPRAQAKAEAKAKAKLQKEEAKAAAQANASPKASAKAVPKAGVKAKKQKLGASAPAPVVRADADDEARPVVRKLDDGTYTGLPSDDDRVRLWPEGCGKCRKKPGCSPSCWWYRSRG